MNWPHEDIHALNEFYGDPRGPGHANPIWGRENIIAWTPPYPMFYSDGKHTPLPHLRIHRKCEGAFTSAFTAVLHSMGTAKIKQLRLDVTGGTYNYRLERGGSRLSVHSWGAAIDMDPGHNPFPHRWVDGQGFIDAQFASILQSFGFCWRGAHGDIDPMHFQLCQH